MVPQMSEPRDDGGPAFPRISSPESHGGVWGMSLRDYFAGEALRYMASTHGSLDIVWEEGAKQAYRAADAMLAERKK